MNVLSLLLTMDFVTMRNHPVKKITKVQLKSENLPFNFNEVQRSSQDNLYHTPQYNAVKTHLNEAGVCQYHQTDAPFWVKTFENAQTWPKYWSSGTFAGNNT